MAQNNDNDPQGQLYGCPCRGCEGTNDMSAQAFMDHAKAHDRRSRACIRTKSGDNGVELPFSICGTCDKVYQNNHHCKGPTTKVFNAAQLPWKCFENVTWEQVFSVPADKPAWARMPGVCRRLFARMLTNMTDYVGSLADDDANWESAWKAFCLLPAMVTQKTDRESKEVLKTRLLALMDCTESYWGARLDKVFALRKRKRGPRDKGSKGNTSEARIMARLACGDVSGAMSLLKRDSDQVMVTQAVIDQLKGKFLQPEQPNDVLTDAARRDDLRQTILAAEETDDINLTVDDIEAGLSRLNLNRAAAGDGCLPEAIKLIQVGALRQLVERITKGQAPESFLDYTFGGRVVPVTKKDGSARPVTVVASLSKLISNCYVAKFQATVLERCGDRQFALGQKNGTELAAAPVIIYLGKDGMCVIQLDLKNAFHQMDRGKALEMLKLLYPEFWKPIALMYCRGNKMVLPRDQTGQAPEVIEMVRGFRQGDPLSSAIMCAMIDHALTEEITRLNAASGALIGYADDQHVCGTADSLIEFWNNATEALAAFGLEISTLKSSVVSIGDSEEARKVHQQLGLDWNQEGINVLGHLHGTHDFIRQELENDLERLDKIALKLISMSSKQGAFRLLWQSFMLQGQHRLKLNHSVRFEEYAEGFDDQAFKVLVSIAGRPIGDWSRRQAGLGFKAGGLALRPLGRAVLPARVATWSRVVGAMDGDRSGCYEKNVTGWLKQALNTETGEAIKRDLDDVHRLYTDLEAVKPVPEGQDKTEYNQLYPRELGDLTGPYTNVHKRITQMSDTLEAEQLKRSMTLNNNNMTLERHRMALVAAQAPLASSYLTALPSGQLFTINAYEFGILVSVRIGLEIEHFQVKHGQATCFCDSPLSIDHAMGCARIPGSFVYQRHNEINRLIQQTLTGGEVSHVRVEPRGQYVGYGDGGPDMSYRQRNGTLVLTDVSVVAARGNTNRQRLMTKTGVLAKAREVKKRKENDAHAKANKAKFIPLVFEARGGFGEDAIKFFKSAARANRTFERSIQPWEYNSHFQYYTKAVSVALARGSAQNLALALKYSK